MQVGSGFAVSGYYGNKVRGYFILALILSEMFGKNCLVKAAFGLSSHSFCHFIIVPSSNSLYIVLLVILLYMIVFSLSLTAAFAIWSASSSYYIIQ